MGGVQSSQAFETLRTIEGCNLFIDIDGTLVSEAETSASFAVKAKVQELKKSNKLWICSNNNDISRNIDIARQLGIGIVGVDSKKPSKKLVKEALKVIDSDNPTLVIGDKCLTDGLFAMRLKCKFLKVKRKTNKKETLIIKAQYYIDNLFSPLFTYEQ